MIVIFSTKDDISTQLIADWLIYQNHAPIIINELNPIVDIRISISNCEEDLFFSTKNGKTISIKEIQVVWYRRGFHFLQYGYFKNFVRDEKYKNIYDNIKNEYDSLIEIMFEMLSERTIGEFNLLYPNKQKHLLEARKAGFDIPSTIICTSKKNSFKVPHVNKNITNIINLELGHDLFYNRTTFQKKYPVNCFFPSLFQKYIEKKYELRIFFFLDLFFPMLIMAKKNDSLKIDIREVGGKDNLLKSRINLPPSLNLKIKSLIKNLRYTTGSIDLIIDKNDKVYFLELNPTGQFYYVSLECGYHIEKEVANKLCKYEKKGFDRNNWFSN